MQNPRKNWLELGMQNRGGKKQEKYKVKIRKYTHKIQKVSIQKIGTLKQNVCRRNSKIISCILKISWNCTVGK